MEKLTLNNDTHVTFTEWNGQQYVAPNPIELPDETVFELPDGNTETLPTVVGTLGECEIILDVETDNIGLKMPNGTTETFFQLKNVIYKKIVSAHLNN